MADVEKQNQVLEEEGPATEEEVAVEVERPSEEAVNEGVEEGNPEEEFYSNLAEDLDHRVLQRMASKLVDEYRRDKISRKDWEQGYTQGLDLLGFKYTEMTRPFRGAANVTHPLISRSRYPISSTSLQRTSPFRRTCPLQSDRKRNSRKTTTSRSCSRFHELYAHG